MIAIDHSDPKFLEITPSGALHESDFAAADAAIDQHTKDNGRAPNLIVRLEGLPHWASFGALSRHFHFVRDHHRDIAKVAAVGDVPMLSAVPEIANLLINTKVRHFPTTKLGDARSWARDMDDDPGRFEEMVGLPDDVLGIRAVGIITAQDYRETLIPLMSKKLEHYRRIKCLIVFDETFTSYTGDAIWSDARFGIHHARDFERVAVVTDVKWITQTAQLLSPLMPFYFKAFRLEELEDAKNWLQ